MDKKEKLFLALNAKLILIGLCMMVAVFVLEDDLKKAELDTQGQTAVNAECIGLK